MTRHLLIASTLVVLACGGPASDPANPNTHTTTGDTGSTGDTTADTGDDPGGTTAADDGDDPDKRKDAGEFDVKESDKAGRPTQGKLEATDKEAAVRFFVVDKETQAGLPGIVISLTAPNGKKYYTGETAADGFAEVLVPIGQDYDLVYLSLGRRNIAAKVKVANEPHLNLKLTMRYKRFDYPKVAPKPEEKPEQRFVLGGVEFETGKAKLTADSYVRLEPVVEYMTHKPSSRIEISGHTDNVGKPKNNLALSQKRAEAVRDYLVSKGIDKGRIEAVGYGDQRPIETNDTKEGRQKNRRIEAVEK